jgi:hypothetical protein
VGNGKYLPVYLNDHLAAAVGGVQLARRAAGSNRDSPYGEQLARLADEINEDRRALQDLLKRLGVRADPMKILASVGAERLGRLKLNGELLRYSPLSRLEELELLSLGVAGKLALWRALRPALRDDPRVGATDFDRLIERATSQHRRLERLRERAAAEALGGRRPRGAPQ